jgi:hypothetical protein
MRILPSARKHGIADEDIVCALSTARESWPIEVGHMKVGRDTRKRILEIGVILDETGEELVIHAMLARPKYMP